MDLDLKRYEDRYKACLRGLTFDWKGRRKKIRLPDTEDDPYRPGYCTQKRFAAMVGISTHGYRSLESGEFRPRMKTYCKVLALFEDFGV